MSRVTEVWLRIKLAANSKMIEVKGNRTRIAEDNNGEPVRLTKNHIHELSNSVRSLEDFLFGISDELALALNCKYFQMRFNIKELHAMLGRLEELSIHADLDKKVWRVTTHTNGAFQIRVDMENGEEVVDIENLSAGFSCCIRNITTLVRKGVRFKMDAPSEEKSLQIA